MEKTTLKRRRRRGPVPKDDLGSYAGVPAVKLRLFYSSHPEMHMGKANALPSFQTPPSRCLYFPHFRQGITGFPAPALSPPKRKGRKNRRPLAPSAFPLICSLIGDFLTSGERRDGIRHAAIPSPAQIFSGAAAHFLKLSFKLTLRLNTRCPGFASLLSRQK